MPCININCILNMDPSNKEAFIFDAPSDAQKKQDNFESLFASEKEQNVDPIQGAIENKKQEEEEFTFTNTNNPNKAQVNELNKYQYVQF